MPKQICEISASSWFYYKEICYDTQSHERKKPFHVYSFKLYRTLTVAQITKYHTMWLCELDIIWKEVI